VRQALSSDAVMRGVRFGNAFSEFGSRNAATFETTICPSGPPHSGGFIVRGRKFYSSGALLAHLVPIAATDDQNRNAPGLTIVDDWSSFGQRIMASGTTLFETVRVRAKHVLSHQQAFDRPTAMGPLAQIIHAAVDAGIARAAIAEAMLAVLGGSSIARVPSRVTKPWRRLRWRSRRPRS
jgi:alkylation response protein AidB-like acyl-CoA dehydrogenase